jgi:opacity protein-like surface antigen
MRVSGMKQGRKSRIAGRAGLCLSLVAGVAALAAPAALAEPAVDEYTLTLPQASGDQHLTPGAPGTVPVAPSATGSGGGSGGTTATDLDGSESEKGLTKKVGSEAELGAPGEEHITPIALDTSKRGVPVIVADTLTETEGGTPLLLAALALIAVGGVWAAFRRRRSTPPAPGA